MTKLNPAIIKAAGFKVGVHSARPERVCRVIRALADHMPEEAIQNAQEVYRDACNSSSNVAEYDAALKEAIAAFLKRCGEME